MSRLHRWWLDLNSSLWFVPTLMTVVAIGLAYGMVLLDLYFGREWITAYPLLFGAGADGARGMLTAIAGSMITVAGLTFSLTLATLAQVASQYTPRLLRNFMRDRTNQVVMGAFVSVFVYCLVVLRTIRGGDEGAFVPSLAVVVGLVLALGSIGMLIFFIHHIASSIQAANVIARAADETARLLEKTFPLDPPAPAPANAPGNPTALAALRWTVVTAPVTGYLQGVDYAALLAVAVSADAVVQMTSTLGSFVTKDAPLATIAAYGSNAAAGNSGGSGAVESATLRAVRACYRLGSQRTLDQDIGFGLRQLVDIALKALSPGINDTTTAVQCIDRLGALLALLAPRVLGVPVLAADGRARVLIESADFTAYLGTAFDQIRASGTGNVAVYVRLLTALRTVATRLGPRPDRRAAVQQQADLTLAAAEKTLETPYEMAQIRAHYRRFAEAALPPMSW